MDSKLRKMMAVASFVLAPTSAALALEAEYYTYGGFEAVASGFQRLSLIFSDGGYRSLFFSVTVMAFSFGGIAIVARASAGVRSNPLSWFFPILVGVVIYLGLVVPTGTIHLYDNQTNKYLAIGGVPDGLVAVAGVLNLVERNMVEIVSTSGDPRSYVDQAGGAGFLGLFQAATRVLTTDDTLMDTSVNKYIRDCVTFELTRPGTTLTVDEFRRTSTDFSASLSKADSPAIYTVYYDLTVPQGQTMTCQQAWTNINAYVGSPTHLEENLQGICSQLGYDTASPASYQKCKTSLQATFSDLGVSGMTTEDFIRQAYLSQRLHDVYRSGNMDALTNFKFLTNSTGSMKAANEWLPIMKGVLTAVALGLVPFLALFIPTPLLGKAISVMLGFFVWLTSWGVTDALLHQFLMDYGSRALEGLRIHSGGSGLGMDAFYFMPNETVKILGMFGTVRMSGLMLATVMTGILVKFGGHALAMMGGGLMGQVQSAGQQAASTALDPAGRASSIKANAWAMPTNAIANSHSFDYNGMMTEGLVSQTWGIEGAAAKVQNMEALQGQGTLPPAPGRLGLGDFARQSQSMDKITTPNGILGYGTTPNQVVSSDLRGEHSATTTDSMGWRLTSNTLKDEHGNDVIGTVAQSGAAGNIRTHLENGKQVVDQIDFVGMSGKFGLGYREDAVNRGAHSLASEQTWGRMRQKVDEDSVVSSEARSFREALGNNVAEEVGRSVEDGSAFRDVSGETHRKIMEAGASVGLGGTSKGILSALTLGTAKFDASASGRYQLIGEDNSSVEFNASEKEINSLRNSANQLRESALSKTLQTSEGLKYASSWSSADMGKEGYSWIQEALSRDTVSTAQDMDMMTVYGLYRTQRDYGSTDIGNIQKVVEDVAVMRNGMPSQQRYLNSDIQEFIAKRYEALKSESVESMVQRDKAARAGVGVRRLHSGANYAAKQVAAAIKDNSFKDPRNKLDGPTEAPRERAENRRGAMSQIEADNGAFDFGSDPLKQLGRDLSRPFIPQPDTPAAKTFPGGPGSGINGSSRSESEE